MQTAGPALPEFYFDRHQQPSAPMWRAWHINSIKTRPHLGDETFEFGPVN
jgi:hypothetical protein